MDIQTCLRSIGRLRGWVAVTAGLWMLGLAGMANAQTSPTCNSAGTVAASVASTGLAEQVGDIVITCTGGTSGLSAIGALYITLNTNITNSLDSNGNPQNLTVSATGAAVSASSPVLSNATTVLVGGISYTVPTPSTTAVTLRLSGVRAAVASIQNGQVPTVVTASIAAVGFSLQTSPVTVAVGSAAVLSSALNNGIPCSGSALPATIDFPGFIAVAGTSSAVRVTESLPAAFVVKSTATTNGTRIIVNLTGYGTGVRLFVPDALVGNSGVTPTSGGEFANAVNGGTYTPFSNQLLLSRVSGADQNGLGGTLVTALPTITTNFTSLTELTVTGGAAYAVYEVIDQNPLAAESFQVPVFMVTAPNNCAATLQTDLSAELAPISTVSIASATALIPRFIAAALSSDCQQIGDCSGSYFPVLSLSSSPIAFTGTASGVVQNAAVAMTNSGGTQLNLSISIVYQTGSGWLTAAPATIPTGTVLAVAANPASLQAGVYTATINVNAGPAGSAAIPVTFTVGPAGVTIQAIVNAASYQSGALAPGSYVALFGSDLTGISGTVTNPIVTFNGLTASVIYVSATQLNLIIPTSLAGQTTAAVVVSANGQVSNTYNMTLTANAPGVFTPGILNSDSSVNSASKPATRGTFVQVYLTGLAVPVVSGTVTVSMGSQTGIQPSFAGAQPTYPALDQINVTVPLALTFTGNSTPLTVCVAPVPFAQPICSASVSLYLQ